MRWIGLLATLLIPTLRCAGEAENPLKIELISETQSIIPGKVFHLGLHLVHPPGHHSYWKHPGIVGLATTVEWEMPQGFSAGEIQWPAPQLVTMAGHVAQGYEGETLLMIPITPPEKWTGPAATLTAKVSWMCCGKTCHPATQVPFSITLPMGKGESNSATQPLFDRFKSKIPSAQGWAQVTVKQEKGRVILTLLPSLSPRDPFWKEDTPCRFFTLDGQVDTDQKQETRIPKEGIFVVTLITSESGPKDPTSLPGVIEIPNGKTPRWIQINPKF